MWEVSIVYYFILFKISLALFLMAVLFAFLSLFFPYFSKGEYVMDVLGHISLFMSLVLLALCGWLWVFDI